MIYIIISICCSVTVAVLLKMAKRYKINIPQTVAWNYMFAIFLSCFFFKPEFKDLIIIPSPVYISLGILLPVVFLFLAASIKNIGIVKTDIAQRLSLFIPVMAAYFLFKENFSVLKCGGLFIGIIAISFTLSRKQQKQSKGNNWLYPILVFLGFGGIDVLFKKVAQTQSIPYTTSLVIVFGLAFLVSLIAVIYLVVYKKTKLEFINLICGCILGIFNFGNILFYLKAHQALASHPSTVFAAMNLGVIILGSFIGISIFKEKLNRLNYIGLALALVSIILITISQMYAI